MAHLEKKGHTTVEVGIFGYALMISIHSRFRSMYYNEYRVHTTELQ